MDGGCIVWTESCPQHYPDLVLGDGGLASVCGNMEIAGPFHLKSSIDTVSGVVGWDGVGVRDKDTW